LSDKPKKPLGIPPFYWATQKPVQRGFVNKQQRQFYMVVTALKIAKVAAFAAVALFLIGVI
jgi:hypothetical protein